MAIDLRSKPFLKRLAVLVGLAVVSFVSYETFYWLTHVYEYDARVEADLITLSSRIDGQIEKIHVEEGQLVKAGDLLISLDSEAKRLQVSALEAEFAREQAQLLRVAAEIDAFEKDLASRLATKQEEIRALRIEHRSQQDRLDLASKNVDRTRILFRKELSSKKTLEEEQDKALILQGKVSSSAARIRVAERALEEVRATSSRMEVMRAEMNIHKENIRKIEALIAKEKAQLKYHEVVSPIDGIVDRVYKYVGEHVEEAERMILLHDRDSLWIEANVDETQLRHLELGQRVTMDIDAYPWPFQVFTGEVTHIGSVTTSEMAGTGAVPTNGKSRKPTQRIPVRIKILDPPEKIAPGMLVEVNIQIYDWVRF